MTAVLLAATLASSLELRAHIVSGHFLQILLVPRGSIPVVVTPRTSLGCYIEVDVMDASGARIGHLGPRATCATPLPSDFQALCPDEADDPRGSEVFGAEFDLIAPGRVRLGVDGELGGLKPQQNYQFVVVYHNDDSSQLGQKQKAKLRGRYGEFWSSAIRLQSRPIPFKCP